MAVVMGLCLALAASAAAPVFVPAQRFTLAWMHSIEKLRWEEDYAVVAAAQPESPPELHALAARVQGSAAGMEPPDGARLVKGWYVYLPPLRKLPELRLTRSEFTPDYELCLHGHCQALSVWLPSDGGVTRLSACTQPDGRIKPRGTPARR